MQPAAVPHWLQEGQPKPIQAGEGDSQQQKMNILKDEDNPGGQVGSL